MRYVRFMRYESTCKIDGAGILSGRVNGAPKMAIESLDIALGESAAHVRGIPTFQRHVVHTPEHALLRGLRNLDFGGI